MERKRASDFPRELLNLFDEYVHGEMSRRDVPGRRGKIRGRRRHRGRPLRDAEAELCLGEQVPPDDPRIRRSATRSPSPQGNGSIKGYLARPANAESCPRSWSSTKIAA